MTIREQLILRLNVYVEEVFPQLSIKHKWPIRFDHCFRRVIYDNVYGKKWCESIPAPVIKNISLDDLETAISLCRFILSNPDELVKLNNKSLAWRNK